MHKLELLIHYCNIIFLKLYINTYYINLAILTYILLRCIMNKQICYEQEHLLSLLFYYYDCFLYFKAWKNNNNNNNDKITKQESKQEGKQERENKSRKTRTEIQEQKFIVIGKESNN